MTQPPINAHRTSIAKLTYAGKTIELPVLSGTEGPSVLDITQVYNELGIFTFDPGFTSTASCYSSITFIDGKEGRLLYRGYAIQELAESCDFLEVAYLLLYGELPSFHEKTEFVKSMTHHTLVHEQISNFYRGFRHDAHPMAIMVGVVGALSAFYHDSLDIHDEEQRKIASIRLIAKMPTLAAMAYKYSVGQPFIYPKNALSYSANLLRMMFAVPCEEYDLNPVLIKAMDRILILHADHEQNASTSTVRLAGSSGGRTHLPVLLQGLLPYGGQPTEALMRLFLICFIKSAISAEFLILLSALRIKTIHSA